MHPPAISCILPIYNEQDSLRPLVHELSRVLQDLGQPYEIICVDDYSRDHSLRVLQEIHRDCQAMRILRHTGNLGQSAAFASGFKAARAPVIITMDADMQHDPADIPRLMQALTPETSMVCGIRANRQDTAIKRLSSSMANAFRNRVVGDGITDAGCTFRAMRRDALQEVFIFNGMHRFLPSILRMQGLLVAELSINHRPRLGGMTKYGIGNRLWRGLLDCAAMRWYARRVLPANRWREIHADPDTPHD